MYFTYNLILSYLKNLVYNSVLNSFKNATKNLQCKFESTGKIYESMTTEILFLKEKISTCAEEAEIEKELINVKILAKYITEIFLINSSSYK